jgi:hypothetical protein
METEDASQDQSLFHALMDISVTEMETVSLCQPQFHTSQPAHQVLAHAKEPSMNCNLKSVFYKQLLHKLHCLLSLQLNPLAHLTKLNLTQIQMMTEMMMMKTQIQMMMEMMMKIMMMEMMMMKIKMMEMMMMKIKMMEMMMMMMFKSRLS